jgi:invasion protein IalB
MAQSLRNCISSAWREIPQVIAALAFVVATLAIATSSPVSAAKQIEQTFGTWVVTCTEPDQGGKSCSMMQSAVRPVPQSNKKALVLRWAISIDAKRQLTQTLIVPTGVSPKEGIRLFLGEAEPIVIQYSFCGPRICFASEPLDAKLAASIKASKKVSASYVRGSKKLVQVELDLKGFDEAYEFIVHQVS